MGFGLDNATIIFGSVKRFSASPSSSLILWALFCAVRLVLSGHPPARLEHSALHPEGGIRKVRFRAARPLAQTIGFRRLAEERLGAAAHPEGLAS